MKVNYFRYNDGGRADAGFLGNSVNDCVTRAICITSGKPYAEVWEFMARNNQADGGRYSADHCIRCYRQWFKDYMTASGYTYITPPDGTRIKDLGPALKPRIIDVRGHYVAQIGEEFQDTIDAVTSGLKIVRGIWEYTAPAQTRLYNVFKGATQLNRYPLNLLQATTMRGLYALNYGGDPEIKPC